MLYVCARALRDGVSEVCAMIVPNPVEGTALVIAAVERGFQGRQLQLLLKVCGEFFVDEQCAVGRQR